VDRLGVPDKANTMNACCPELSVPWLHQSGTLVGLTAGSFVQRTLLIIFACTVLAAPFFVSASPAPGCADSTSPGSWTETRSEFGDWERSLDLCDGLTYRIQGSYAYLTNALGTPWYSAADTNISFEIYLTSLVVTTRSPGDPSTNGGYMEVELAAYGPQFLYLATYAGFPSVTYVPEDPETGCGAYWVTNAPLSWARICVGSADGNQGVPLNIRGPLTTNSQVELAWTSVSNGLYQLQCCSDLAPNLWTNWGSPIPGTGASHRVLDVIYAQQRFYRILEFR
jgi:hypothetical protein